MAEIREDIHKPLIEQSKKGKRSAQYELYKLYSRAMFNICLRMMGKREEAEDMLQEVFIEAFSKLDRFRYESTFGAWIKRITVNKCINELKRRKADLNYFDQIPENKMEHSESEISDDLLNVDKVKSAMEKLPEGGRIIFNLYLLEGYDHKEIAQILDISESTSKSQYMRAKNKVREILERSMYEN